VTASDTTTETPRLDRGEAIEDFVQRQAARLWNGYQADRGREVAELAQLRRALPRRGVLPSEAWPIFERPGFDERLAGRGDDASSAELSVAAALALYANHQQSRRSAPMHRRGYNHGVGRAAFALKARVDSAGVERRVQTLIRAQSLDQVLEHLSGLIGQLRAHEIALDYARLARDLDAIQHPAARKGVRTRWSRDFYRPAGDQDTGTDNEQDSGEPA